MTIYIVERSPTLRRMMRAVLERAGLTGVTEASDIEDAVAVFADAPPGVVILGPEPGAYTPTAIAAQFSEHPDYRHTSVLLVTTQGTPEDVLQALKVGIETYIVLPIKPRRFAEKVAQALEKAARLAPHLAPSPLRKVHIPRKPR